MEAVNVITFHGEKGVILQSTQTVNISRNLLLAYHSFGVVYGDLSISPLYVYKSVFVGKLLRDKNQDTIFGAFSLIFWTLTLIPLLKYVFILLSADDNGEGGTIALYSLLCRHAKFGLLPNQQAADEELCCYKYGPSKHFVASSSLKKFLDKHKKSRRRLLFVVLLSACMIIGDGVITPAMAVLTSISGLDTGKRYLSQGDVLLISCVVLIGLFAFHHCGTHKVAAFFAPIVIIWLISIFAIGLYNTIYWNPKIIFSLSPHYIAKYFKEGGKDGWISLGGVLLSTTVPAKLVELYLDMRRSSEEHVLGFTEPSSEKLLPDLHPMEKHVFTLVLDLNETLLYSDWKRERGWRTFKRPGINDFLEHLAQFYEIIVYSDQLNMYVDPTVDRMDPKHCIKYSLSRDATKYLNGKHYRVPMLGLHPACCCPPFSLLWELAIPLGFLCHFLYVAVLVL